MTFSLFAIVAPNRGDAASSIRNRPIVHGDEIGFLEHVVPPANEKVPMLYECIFRTGRRQLPATAFTFFRG